MGQTAAPPLCNLAASAVREEDSDFPHSKETDSRIKASERPWRLKAKVKSNALHEQVLDEITDDFSHSLSLPDIEQETSWSLPICCGEITSRDMNNGFVVTRTQNAHNLKMLQDQIFSGARKTLSNSNAFAAIRDDGSVVCWGNPSLGGDSSRVDHELRDGTVELYCTAGAFLALKEDGSLVAWGDPALGGIIPQIVSDKATQGAIKIIKCNLGAFAALLADGSVIAWGDDRFGGDTAVVQGDLWGVKELVAGASFFVALKDDESMITWGPASSAL
eukprot:TRINITY_DN8830_c0_g1_i2.p1 TRINITY_DN8830_c0_g1~~TRINITY_DN8830_c0_g1_i2.p1  ORF type:complete len:276 (+),score=51.84 TRINITY_DN8830_c0_g1_i2:71-898(+)